MQRRCRYVCSLIAVILTSSVGLQAETEKPSIHLPEPSYSFGTVSEGTKIEHEFTVKNRGSAALVLQRVVAGCGCTAVTSVNQPIEPGAESKIKVTLETSGMSGRQSKSVRIYSNDTENPISDVSLNGTVEQKVAVEPKNLFFEKVTRGQKDAPRRQVTLRAGGNSGVKIGKVESFSKFVKIENLSGDEKQKTFTVVLDSNLPLGDFRDRVIVNMEGESRGNVNVPIYAQVKGHLQVSPPAVSFGIISGKEPIMRKIKVENNSDIPYLLQTIETNNDAVQASIVPEKAGKLYTVEVKLDPSKVKTDLRAELKFKADTALEESVSVNIYGVLPPAL